MLRSFKAPIPRQLRAVCAGVIAAVCMSSVAGADDWTSYRGPTHDACSAEKGFVDAWKAKAPKVLWKVPIGPSFGQFAVAGDKAYLFVADGRDEGLQCLDAKTGRTKWATKLGPTIEDKQGGSNPRSTPTIDGDKVYVLGTGLGNKKQGPWPLVCMDEKGKIVWKHDLMAEFGGMQIPWGSAASPIIDGELLYVAGGGSGKSMMAFDKKTGILAWAVGSEKMTHASPVPCTIGGVRQVIFYVQKYLISLDAKTGNELWKYAFPFVTSTAADPVVNGDMVYCSAGYGVGSAAIKVEKAGDKFNVTELWKQKDRNNNVNHWSTPLAFEGNIYGIFGFKSFGDGPLKCVDMATGNDKWTSNGFGSGGGTIYIDGSLLVQRDSGKITLVKADPAGSKVLGELDVIHATPPYSDKAKVKCWSAAIVANGRIYAHTTEQAICWDVNGK